jgi:alpha-1,2-mannosyltransferase
MHGLGLLLGAVGIAGYLQWATGGGLVRDGNWIGLDFHVYYQAALVLRRGEDIYRAGISPLYIYPPLLAMLVTPLSLLPITAATILWKILQHIWLLLAGGLLVSLLPRRSRLLATGVLLLGGLTAPLQSEIELGESNSLILVLIAGALWLMVQGDLLRHGGPASRAGISGLLLAIAASIKVLPLLLIAYVGWRGSRVAAATAISGFLALQALQLLLTPLTLDYWLREFPGLFGQAFPYFENQSFNAAIARALLPGFDPGLPSPQLADGAALRPALTWLANGALLLATIAVLARAARWPALAAPPAPHLLAQAGLVLITTHLISGSTWLHHLVDLAVPLIALLAVSDWGVTAGYRSLITRRAVVSLLGVGLVLALLIPRPAMWIDWAAGLAPGSNPAVWLASNVPLWVMLGLWSWLAVEILRPRPVLIARWGVTRSQDEGIPPASS